ncbi:MAG TPA: helix-hairpin-helix domain-containing protein [Nitrospira sp.]|nr:helix-hairpin-helix domain-containing protein [Nitrospira sp.]
MLASFLLKLAMLMVTMGMMFWIGWSMPQSRSVDVNQESDGEGKSVYSVSSPRAPVDPAAALLPLDPSHATPRVSRPAFNRQLDLNRATEQDFESLPGIGPVIAHRIVQFRQLRGGFTGVDQLRKVKGIGSKTFGRIRTLVSVTAPSISASGRREAP